MIKLSSLLLQLGLIVRLPVLRINWQKSITKPIINWLLPKLEEDARFRIKDGQIIAQEGRHRRNLEKHCYVVFVLKTTFAVIILFTWSKNVDDALSVDGGKLNEDYVSDTYVCELYPIQSMIRIYRRVHRMPWPIVLITVCTVQPRHF